MDYKALKEVASITMGQSPNSSSYNDNGLGLPFFQGNADFGEVYPSERVWCSEPKKTAKSGDILISVRAPIGALNYAKTDCCIGRGLAAITVKNSIERNYIYHLLKARHAELNSKGTGSTFKAIGKKVLEELRVPIVSDAEKKRAMQLMDSAEKIIRQRKDELKLFDDLVKARFVEMFGECKEFVPIGQSGMTISDGNYSSKYPRSDEFVEKGVPFIRANNIKECTINDEDMYFITDEKHAILLKGHLKSNDILITTRGNIGQVALVPKRHNDSNINAQIVLLRDERGRFLPRYLLWALQTEEVKRQFANLQTGTALRQLPVGRLEQVAIQEPPLASQKRFATFVAQVDKSKVAVQKSLDEAQLLFDSLMQKYFG